MRIELWPRIFASVARSIPSSAMRVAKVCHLKQGDVQAAKSPADVGTGKAKDEKGPLSEIIQVLNEPFGTQFTEEDRLFFQQIKENAVKKSFSSIRSTMKS